jgi:hypothetical protein
MLWMRLVGQRQVAGELAGARRAASCGSARARRDETGRRVLMAAVSSSSRERSLRGMSARRATEEGAGMLCRGREGRGAAL